VPRTNSRTSTRGVKPHAAKRRGPNDGRSIPASANVTPLLDTRDVCALLRVSRQTLWELRKRAGFPMAIVLNNSVGTGSPRWKLEEVEAFLEARRADRVGG
jgi:predicted DNA-binding transcriptional regulator AlpA